ncbi:hypothetical protein BN2476_110187 [Paraburkholderia piptadeniae]|uniref:Uncharacterized protein n=1 Tax=Paraburkholderia piptadeniae TaxID=1701573 RepID=A0A1N7RQB3_9BURK|nr:hypothetical protein BN2476_110187 [Paraburkholderia piptadeniae]
MRSRGVGTLDNGLERLYDDTVALSWFENVTPKQPTAHSKIRARIFICLRPLRSPYPVTITR